MKVIRYIIPAIGISLLVVFNSCRTIPKGVKAVKPFNKEKYLGKWYEIARMDYKFERNLNNVTAEYVLRTDGKIAVDNKGYNFKKNEWEESVGKAKSVGDPEDGKLKVSFFGPFYSGYNIIAIDKDYKYAMVAGKNKDYLWLLSREKTMSETVKQEYLNTAKELGFKTDKLIWVSHDKDSKP